MYWWVQIFSGKCKILAGGSDDIHRWDYWTRVQHDGCCDLTSVQRQQEFQHTFKMVCGQKFYFLECCYCTCKNVFKQYFYDIFGGAWYSRVLLSREENVKYPFMNAVMFIVLNKCDFHTACTRTFLDAVLKVFKP